MTFAPGWTQSIDTDGPRERADLLSYISDTHKAVYGFRPRWEREWADNTPIADLRKEAEKLEADVIAEARAELVREARRQQEMAAHHLQYQRRRSQSLVPLNLLLISRRC